jgi:hypothetical protein
VETAQWSAPVSHGVLGRNKSFWLESVRVAEVVVVCLTCTSLQREAF